MKILIGLAVALLAVVVVHPIPVAVHLESNSSYAMAHGYEMHWDGVRRTDINLSHVKRSMSSSACSK